MQIRYTEGDRIIVSETAPRHAGKSGVVIHVGKIAVDVLLDYANTRTAFMRDELALENDHLTFFPDIDGI